MISSKTLIKLARKWQRLATLTRERISSPKAAEVGPCGSSSRAEKGHFAVYSADEKRFMVPLAYLKSSIFVQLLDMALEEFRVLGDSPIMLSWDANFVEYVLSLLHRCAAGESYKAFVVSMARSHCLSSSQLHEGHTRYQSSICSF